MAFLKVIETSAGVWYVPRYAKPGDIVLAKHRGKERLLTVYKMGTKWAVLCYRIGKPSPVAERGQWRTTQAPIETGAA
mgnify:CR=1 FL=1